LFRVRRGEREEAKTWAESFPEGSMRAKSRSLMESHEWEWICAEVPERETAFEVTCR
jgi:hypothetical protein